MEYLLFWQDCHSTDRKPGKSVSPAYRIFRYPIFLGLIHGVFKSMKQSVLRSWNPPRIHASNGTLGLIEGTTRGNNPG
jgi:hypothetical protein